LLAINIFLWGYFAWLHKPGFSQGRLNTAQGHIATKTGSSFILLSKLQTTEA
jgi:hypothetical protein